MKNPSPTFPPLLNGHRLAADKIPMNWAKSRAAKGRLGAGDLAWSEHFDKLRYALILEPDVERERCGEILFAAMVAFGDAAGALIPPEVSITYRWPNVILMNDGVIGQMDLAISEEEIEHVPRWMVLGLDIRIRPDQIELNPGLDYNHTTMWDEGCGDITRTQLLESSARHTLNAIHNWSEDGFRPIHDQWSERISQKGALAAELVQDEAQYLGMDETGNALISAQAGTTSLPLWEALDRIRTERQD